MREVDRHVHFKVFKSFFKSWESMFAEAAAFAESIGPERLFAYRIRRTRAKPLSQSGIGLMSREEAEYRSPQNVRSVQEERSWKPRGTQNRELLCRALH